MTRKPSLSDKIRRAHKRHFYAVPGYGQIVFHGTCGTNEDKVLAKKPGDPSYFGCFCLDEQASAHVLDEIGSGN